MLLLLRLAGILVFLHADVMCYHHTPLLSDPTQVLFSELISAGSYLQFPAGCGRWKTAKKKNKRTKFKFLWT